MMIDESRNLVRRSFEDAPRNSNICDEIFASSFLFQAIQHIKMPTTESDPQSEKAACEELAATWYADWRIVIDEMIAEGDRVVSRLVWRGTHRGEWKLGVYGPVQPTGASFAVAAVNIVRIAEGRIAEEWETFDWLGLARQLGEIVPPGA